MMTSPWGLRHPRGWARRPLETSAAPEGRECYAPPNMLQHPSAHHVVVVVIHVMRRRQVLKLRCAAPGALELIVDLPLLLDERLYFAIVFLTGPKALLVIVRIWCDGLVTDLAVDCINLQTATSPNAESHSCPACRRIRTNIANRSMRA